MTGVTSNRVIPVIFVFYCIILKISLLEKTLIYQALWQILFRKNKIIFEKDCNFMITGVIIICEERVKWLRGNNDDDWIKI